MKTIKTSAFLLAGLLAAPVFAQGVSAEVQRNVQQQQRIEAGLQSGALTTREAAKLENEQSRINRAQSQALKDGNLTSQEKQRIDRMQDRASGHINAQSHDNQLGNPQSASSRRMQADVARNVAQQQRIGAGIKNGSLTNREAGKLERGQARVAKNEARAGRDGHVGRREQGRIQRVETHASRQIRYERHDVRRRG